MTIRIATWNLDHNPAQQLERTGWAADELALDRPDVLCIQETNPTRTRLLADRLGMAVVVEHEAAGLAIVSSLTQVHAEMTDMPSGRSAVMAFLENDCHRFAVATTHLAWGTGMEALRLKQAFELDAWIGRVASMEPFRDTPHGAANGIIGILCGDMNAEPDADSMRYLRGVHVYNDTSTHWTDSWNRGVGDGVTSSGHNPLSARTAAAFGVLESTPLPERRIDYIFSRGYAYGRAGSATSTALLGVGRGAETPSDHYGIVTDLVC